MVQVICERYATLGWFRATSKEVTNGSLALIVANGVFVSIWSSLVWLIALLRVAQVVVLIVSIGKSLLDFRFLKLYKILQKRYSTGIFSILNSCLVSRNRFKFTIHRQFHEKERNNKSILFPLFCPTLIKLKLRVVIIGIDIFCCLLKGFKDYIKHPLRKKNKAEKAFSVETQSI